MSADLVVNLESPLPPGLPAGTATAVFCYGTCFHRRRPVRDVSLLVDGVPHAAAASGMPRRDVDIPVRSGFWGTVPVPAHAEGDVELALRARLTGGEEEVAPLGRIAVVAPTPPPPLGHSAGELIAVCMATYDPDPALFEVQIESLRAQTDRDWLCVISDDGSSPEALARIEATLAGDPRFSLSPAPRRLGFYRNFERAIRLAPSAAPLLALCDQDDRWEPDKLAVLRAAIGSASMAYSDQRLVDADGRTLRETMWEGRRNNHTDLASLLIANSITGAATLFRREIAELALPFPDTPGLQFHDHWLGLVALATGRIAYVDRPLYDYVQHGGAVFGDVTSGGRGRRRRSLVRGGRGAYFLGYLAREVQAQVLLARCAHRLTPRKRRALRRFVRAGRSPLAAGWLAARPVRVVAGRTETLGSETELVRGLAWRWAVDRAARLPVLARRPWVDAAFPDALAFEQRRLRAWRARA